MTKRDTAARQHLRMTRTTPADRDVPLENCEAVCIWFGKLNCAIVWQDRPKYVRPVERGSLSGICSRDRVTYRGEPRVVWRLKVYR